MSDQRQAGLLDLFSHVGKPIPPQSVLNREVESTSSTVYESADVPSRTSPVDPIIGRAPRGTFCSLFEPQVMEEAMALSRLLTKQPSYDDFLQVSKRFRQTVNEELLVFAMSYAVLNRADTRTLQVPPVEEIIPYWYFPRSVIAEAQRRAREAGPTSTEEIVVSYKSLSTEDDPESRISYFREDVSVNSHHWHWHQAYPYDDVDKKMDRKGELFYYMHHQILARYDAERMSNGLGRTAPLNDFRYESVLEEGYYPDLNATNSGGVYASRPPNAMASDIDSATIEDMIRWKTHITDAIDEGFVVKESGERVRLEEPRGIDILGDIIESAFISVDLQFYGNYHNIGHLIIARAHNPDGNFDAQHPTPEPQGVMANTSTAMRDPIFYRWHREVDNIFNKYKMTLQPYTRDELEWCGIHVYDVSVSGEWSKRCNYLQTFWKDRKVLLSRGLDFGLDREVSVNITHLQHEEFVYNIDVDNLTDRNRQVTVRIFLTPIVNEYHQLLTFEEQRMLFIELEKYQTTVRPGRQVLKRSSKHSNVTIAPARGFNLLQNLDPSQPLTDVQSFCGCGWPDHLLIPKGTPEGMGFVLLVMLTNWDKDKVDNLPDKSCGDAASYCGVRDQKYPDRRTMGFPFDRRFNCGETLESFARLSNVAMREVTIRHSGDEVVIDGDWTNTVDDCQRYGCYGYGWHQSGCGQYGCGKTVCPQYDCGRRPYGCRDYGCNGQPCRQ